SATLTRWRSVVRNHYRPPLNHLVRSLFASGFFVVWGKNHQKGRKKAEIVLRKIPKETFKASYRMIKTRVTLSFDS
ncbi:MAG: hypothetical protein Q3X14_05750, partial [Eggerthellaceae bacterium]|nr:hypothetical protein [Eggerthellaceae bacterium]